MQSIRPPVERTWARLLLIVPCLLVLYCTQVRADEADAFNFTLGSNRTRDDNVFRLSPDTDALAVLGSRERGDTISNSYLVGTFSKLIGRQRLLLDVNLNQSRYEGFSFLDYDGSNLAASLDWRLTNLLSGRIGRTRVSSLGSFADLRDPVKNIYTTEATYASLDFWVLPDWHVEAELRRSTAGNESNTNRIGDSVVDQWKAGLRYTPRNGSQILIRAIRMDGRLPNREFVAGSFIDNSYQQSELGIEALSPLTGKSRVTAVLAQTQREHVNVPSRDFSGITGSLKWDWAVSGKLQLASRVRREVGASGDLLASYILTDGADLTLNWLPTAKITLSLRYDKSRRDFSGDPVSFLAGQEKRQDQLDTLSLNLSYRPMQSVMLTLGLTRSQRDSNFAGLPFEVTSSTLGGQFSF